MTAEIVIMNKTAISLAADSAVTFTHQGGQKIYNTVNKLFMLSKFRPVGIMIYGAAELMGIPWESIIKTYRNDLCSKEFDTLKEYADHFLLYLAKNQTLFPESIQIAYFQMTVYNYFIQFKNEIDLEVKKRIEQNTSVSTKDVEIIVSDIVRKHHDEWQNYPKLDLLPDGYNSIVSNKFDAVLDKIKSDVFQDLPMTPDTLAQLKQIAGNLFFKNQVQPFFSGVVFAGFGAKETFPSLVSYYVEHVLCDHLRYRNDRSFSVDLNQNSVICYFAQGEMVSTFMEGIDPAHKTTIEGYLSTIFDKYPTEIVESLPNIDPKEKDQLGEKLKGIGQNLLKDFQQKINEYRLQKHVRPVLNAVSLLPKDELAAMAESLVNLTSFKRKVSMDAETVGGAIDVAVISKGDGFIWIKRKHYFKPELNPYFFANYYRNDSPKSDIDEKDGL